MDQNLLPTRIKAGETSADVLSRLRVVDTASGAAIDRVVEADTDAGTVRRHVVENGNLVREGDRFAILDETRAIRFEWTDGAPSVGAPAAVLAGEVQAC